MTDMLDALGTGVLDAMEAEHIEYPHPEAGEFGMLYHAKLVDIGIFVYPDHFELEFEIIPGINGPDNHTYENKEQFTYILFQTIQAAEGRCQHTDVRDFHWWWRTYVNK